MGIMILWLMISYSLVLGVCVALLREGMLWALLPMLAFTAWRLYRRFRPDIGYYVPGYGNEQSDAMAAMSGRVTRAGNRSRFKLYLAVELAVVVGLLGLFLLPAVAVP